MLAPAVVVMGVSGVGKTTVGEAVARRLGFVFRDADEFHPPANVAKMSAGIPLSDEDRWPWLDAIGAAIRDDRHGIVVTCSALKRSYRERITSAARRPVKFVFLHGTRETIAGRLAGRKGHFMPPSLLDSQLATLEAPTVEERAISVSVEPPVEEVVEALLTGLRAQSG
jgi:gluconokinase